MRKQTQLCGPVGSSHTGTLIIDRTTFDEVINYAKAAGKSEICGYLLVRRLSPETFVVLDDSLHIPLQMAGAGASETLPHGEVAQMDREDDADDDTFRLLWHSHVGGAAMFSSTDLNTQHSLGQTTDFDAMFFMVVNQRGQATANLEIYRPFRMGTQLRLVVLEPQEEKDLEPYKAVIEQVVTPYPKPKRSLSLLDPSDDDMEEEGAWHSH